MWWILPFRLPGSGTTRGFHEMRQPGMANDGGRRSGDACLAARRGHYKEWQILLRDAWSVPYRVITVTYTKGEPR